MLDGQSSFLLLARKLNLLTKEILLSWRLLFLKMGSWNGRKAEKGIYVPPFPTLSTHNVMGVKWFTGSLPDTMYKHFAKMKIALQVDLEFHLAKNPAQLKLVQKQQCCYSVFHTLVMSQYTNLY